MLQRQRAPPADGGVGGKKKKQKVGRIEFLASRLEVCASN